MANGLPVDVSLISLSDYYAEDGFLAASRLLSADIQFDAAIAVNDNVAIGAVRALKDYGMSVPEDVSLVSCDAFFLADYLNPRLTTIDHHNRELAETVISQLLGMIQKKDLPAVAEPNADLIIRESSMHSRKPEDREKKGERK